MIPFRKARGANGLVTITAFNPELDEPVVTVTERHPNFNEIETRLNAGDESVWELFDIGASVRRKFEQVTERVSFDGTDILFDGDPIHSTLAQQVLRALESGEQDYRALALFWEKLESNPNEHSRTQAYDWLATHDFKITPEGDLVAYKGVERNYTWNNGHSGSEGYRSCASGSAFVNGERKDGQIPQNLGDEVSMPRSEVQHDPTVGCHKGLHVGDYSYASGYGNVCLEIHVNPRDIVSVPTDCGARKMRTCKYKVVAEVTAEYAGKSPVLASAGASTGWQGDVGYNV